MKKFIIKTFVLGLVTFTLLSILGMVVDAGLKKSKCDELCEIYNGNLEAV